MKHSIRYRFAIIFVGMTALILLAIWFANNWWLESYYMADKVRALEFAYDQIDAAVRRGAETGESIVEQFSQEHESEDETEKTLAALLLEFSEKNNTAIVLIDSTTGKAVLSSARDGTFLAKKVQGYILGKDLPESETIKEHANYNIQRNYDPRVKSSYLESWGYFCDNSTIFIMSTPLESIRESVNLSNRFLAHLGMIALVFSSIVIYFTTRRVTSPIMKLSALSEQMSRLDFSARYVGDAQDELGILGNSMNALADQLDETIGELQSANQQLQLDINEKIKIDEMRKDFIADVSHELKTPIALIQGYAEGLTEGMCEDEESRNYYCEVIVDEANKMNKMVRQLLTLTALEFGNDEPSRERFDLAELIRGVINAAKIMNRLKDVEIVFVQEAPVFAIADEFKIEEVVTNYLSNALNHAEDTGNGKQIVFEISKPEGKVSVFNTGRMIPEEDIPNLWIKFYKVDKARTREYGGSGIGLSIVKAIMEAHRKSCGVRNREDGVEFWFTLDIED